MTAIYSDKIKHGEFYYIAAVDNLLSIFEHGILSHNRALKYSPQDVSNSEVQDIRAEKIVPNIARANKNKSALKVHDYANLYFNAHNNMMFVVKNKDICVLRVDPRILSRDEVIVSKRNAARSDAEFVTSTNIKFSPESSRMLKSPKCLGGFHDAIETKDKRKAVRQSEILAPYEIHPSFIRGIYVKSNEQLKRIQKILCDADLENIVTLTEKPELFFAKSPSRFTVPSRIEENCKNTKHPEIINSLPESDEEEIFEMEE